MPNTYTSNDAIEAAARRAVQRSRDRKTEGKGGESKAEDEDGAGPRAEAGRTQCFVWGEWMTSPNTTPRSP